MDYLSSVKVCAGLRLGSFDGDSFGNTEPRAVAGHQRGAVLQAGYVLKNFSTSSRESTTGSVLPVRIRGAAPGDRAVA